jgi:hypothetical protein
MQEMGNNIHELNLTHRELYIKAGTHKRVYFSNEYEDCVLKLDVLL